MQPTTSTFLSSTLQSSNLKLLQVRKVPDGIDILKELQSAPKKINKEQKYSCSICHERFSNKRKQRKHENEHDTNHVPRSMLYVPRCEACNLDFKNLTEYRDHQKQFHPVLISTSGEAVQKSTFVSQNKELEKYKFECNICGRVFPRKHVLAKHIKKHSGIKEEKPQVLVECKECNKIFRSQCELRDHNIVHHTPDAPIYKCEQCGDEFKLQSLLNQHVKYNHVLQATILCGIDGCPKTFKTNSQLKWHLQTSAHLSNVDKPFKCQECGRGFQHRDGLKSHMLVHNDVKTFVCDQCPVNKVFRGKTAISLRDHKIRIHSGIKKYACKICSKPFNDNSACKRHEEIHANKKYKCTQCNKYEGTTKCSLRAHIRVKHTPVIKFKCPECHKELANTSSLKIHMLLHSPEGKPKPYKCPWPDGCDKVFDKSGLKKHYRTHTGERPYICKYEGCTNAYADSSTLRQHMMIHLELKRFVCHYDECGYACIQSHTLKNHIIAKHTAEGIQRQKKSENYLFKALAKYGIQCKREHTVNLKCANMGGTKASIDLVYYSNGIVHFIENDENQHNDRNISCECARMINVQSSLMLEGNTLPIMFWRFNPHNYKKNTVRQKHTVDQRVQYLVQQIQHFSSLPKEQILPLTIHYICYTMLNNKLEIMEDPEYEDCLKPCVVIHQLPSKN